MTPRLLTLLAVIFPLAALSGSVAAAQVAPAPGTCLDNWSDAAPIVASEGLIPARDIQLYSRRRHGSDVVRITLCREASGYIYRLLLRDDRGRLSHVRIEALPLSAAAAPEPVR